MKCEEKGCMAEGIECSLDAYDDEGNFLKTESYFYCANHAQKNGFCHLCGQFWGGIESFEFGPGCCENCAFDLEDYEDFDEECFEPAEFGEEDWDE